MDKVQGSDSSESHFCSLRIPKMMEIIETDEITQNGANQSTVNQIKSVQQKKVKMESDSNH